MAMRPTLAVPLPLRHPRPAKLAERRVPVVLVLLSLALLLSVLLSPARFALQSLFGGSTSGGGRFCDVAPCVFDVGHNSGQDTQDYLTTGPSNTRVVAVDANPVLIARSTQRFASAVQTGRLALVNVGLVETATGDNLTFWINDLNDKFSSFKEGLGCRDGWGRDTKAGSAERKCHRVNIPTRTCAQLLRQFGTPVYLKIDIEGMDMVCLRTLKELSFGQRPTYVSIENVWRGGVEQLVALGYTRFKVVNQLNVSIGRPAELEGASGPWGEQAVDCQTGHEWSSQKQLLARMDSLPKSMWHDGKDKMIWYDLHGKLHA